MLIFASIVFFQDLRIFKTAMSSYIIVREYHHLNCSLIDKKIYNKLPLILLIVLGDDPKSVHMHIRTHRR